MSLIMLFARWILSLVFAVAGFAKLADMAGSRAAFRNFGVSEWLASPFGVLLPVVELVIALALLLSFSFWWAAIGAAALLLVFVAGIGYNLARGRAPDCHCFGQLHSAPVGPSTLMRNLVLAALAGIVVGFGRAKTEFDLGSWLGQLSLEWLLTLIGGVVVLIVFGGILWLMWHILQQQGRLLLRLEAAEAFGPSRVRLSDEQQSPLVSVVIAVHNGERYLQAAVKSILEQTLQQIEIIVVNDGSTDNTGQIINALASDPRVKPIHQDHLGISHARRTGTAQAQAKYIAVQDADDLSLPVRLAKQYSFLERFPEFGLVASFADVMNEAGVVEVVTQARQQRRQLLERSNLHELRTLLLQANYIVHGSVMMRKSVCEAVGNYREVFSLAGDYDLWLRIAERYALGILPEVLYQYRVHSDNVSRKKAYEQQARARIARELAYERRQTGMDILQRGGTAAFLTKYGVELQVAERNDQKLERGQQEASEAARQQSQEA